METVPVKHFRTRRKPGRRSGSRCHYLTALFVSLLAAAAFGGQDTSRINADGTVDFTVHYAYPPTSDDIDSLQSVIRSASEIFCDATDNNLRFGNVTIAAGGGSEAIADVWILPPGLWNRSSSSGFLLDDGSRVFITQSGRTNTTFAHEMAHAVLRLSDGYDEQSRTGKFHGIGFAIEPGKCSITGDFCADDSNCGAAESCVGSAMSSSENTLMGNNFSAPRCSTSGTTCYGGDKSCNGGTDVCETPVYYSEFTVASNYDVLAGDNLSCPSLRASAQILVTGRLGADASTEVFQYATFDDAESSSRGTATLRYMDSFGVLTGYEKESSHNLRVYAEHTDAAARTWTLHFLMDGKHLDGETAGEPVLLGSIDIDFNGGLGVYPPTGDPAYQLRVCNGGSCLAPGSPGYSHPTITIPETSNSAPAAQLTVVFDNAEQLVLQTGTAQAELKRSKILASDGGQVIGDCAATAIALGGDYGDLCQQTVCSGMWNTTTLRWEATGYTISALMGETTYSSEWDDIANLPSVYVQSDERPEEDAFNAPISAPVALPTAAPGICSSAGNLVHFDTHITGNDTLMLAIDTSLSMNEDHDSFGVTKTRLEWAQAASRALADLVENNNTNFPDAQSIGLVRFAGSAKQVFPPDTLGLPGSATAADFHMAVDALLANGNTALPAGLQEAGSAALHHPRTRNPAVVALTDGAANVCLKGVKCGTEDATAEAVDVVEELADDGVDVYFTPIGGQLGTGVFGDAVSGVGGEIFYSESARDIPIQFARAYLRHSGHAAIMDARAWILDPAAGQGLVQFNLEVEPGATKLNIYLSSRNDDVDNWAVSFRLRSPSGIFHQPNSAIVTTTNDQGGNFYRIVQVDVNEAGLWRLDLLPSNGSVQQGYAMAWTDTPQPDCYAGVPAPVIRSTANGVVISAQASWHLPIDGAQYTAVVKRPDGTTVAVPLKNGQAESTAQGTFTQFAGRGLYQVTVSCVVQNAQFWYGEDVDADTPADPVDAPGFYRETVTAFFADISDYPPLPQGRDCDGDGIPNQQEGVVCLSRLHQCVPGPESMDTDGDHVINACDLDSDNDDLPDSDESTADSDGDGIPNILDPDSDNDGQLDGGDRTPYGGLLR